MQLLQLLPVCTWVVNTAAVVAVAVLWMEPAGSVVALTAIAPAVYRVPAVRLMRAQAVGLGAPASGVQSLLKHGSRVTPAAVVGHSVSTNFSQSPTVGRVGGRPTTTVAVVFPMAGEAATVTEAGGLQARASGCGQGNMQ